MSITNWAITFPHPIMIMRKNVRVMRVLMVIVTVSDHFPFVIEPPALNLLPVYI